MSPELESLRLDKWLWAARFFKTRADAAEAINGGKVHVNKQRAKPGKDIKVGAQLSISKDRYRWEITVTALSGQRRAAKDAALLYEESPESHAQRQLQIIQQREQREFLAINGIDHKPNKKERRLIHRFKDGQ
ncbi:RNA-binding S4 domain-containing protein [Methylovulum psychrotolerans]|uniref:Heat shock protein 15 n=1 Tax=Methylovulum psychrotolerans TaxID=1704499 RepID=A0A1Z4BVA1_9GAMM|nr:S4 domain-containing protein [Methylovulum psychrotolerans]ASF45173.1 RNA-binding protein [Methylovulum psychrotolerans]POZ50498.1 RNA-binding protein [Methylovulum psychrotolerans]